MSVQTQRLNAQHEACCDAWSKLLDLDYVLKDVKCDELRLMAINLRCAVGDLKSELARKLESGNGSPRRG